jgi:protein-tyrosine phosphatase
MSESRTPTRSERIDLDLADDPRDVVHRAVASLAQGEAVALEAEGLAGVVASALQPRAVAALAGLPPAAGGGGNGIATLLLKEAGELADWVPDRPPLAARLARRVWPGPVTLVLPRPKRESLYDRLDPTVRSRLVGSDTVALHEPPQRFLRDVLRLSPGPLVFHELSKPVKPGGDPFAALGAAESIGLLIRSTSTAAASPQGTTVVRVDSSGWSVLRPGPVGNDALTRLAGTTVLFVCTGNTCRSPMAEALCKVLLAERLNCPVGELEARGYIIASAGIAASSGMPAAANAIDVVQERGGSLSSHRSRHLTAELVRHADLILAMTGDHLDALLEHIPEAAPRVRLLHPEGEDVADPVGADRDIYLRTAEAIETYLTPIIDWLAPAPPGGR